MRKVNPVDRVWVLNPSHSSEDVINKKNEGIKFVQLIPGEDHSNIITESKNMQLIVLIQF